jgi:hypothetical protein
MDAGGQGLCPAGDVPGAQLYFAIWVHWLRAEVPAMHAHVAELLALASREHFPYWTVQATMWRSWALTVQGQPVEGLAQFHQWWTARRASGARTYHTLPMTLMVDAYQRDGQAEMGLRLVTEAQASMETTGERFHEVELWRLKGELLLQQAPPDVCQAEGCFQQALALAQRQHARSLELRVALRLSRLWQQPCRPRMSEAVPATVPPGKRIYREATVEEQERHRRVREQIQQEVPDIKQRAMQHLADAMQRGIAIQQTMAVLKAERRKKGVSLSEMKERTGIERSTLSPLENQTDANPTI